MVATAPLGAFRGASAVALERQLLYKRLATAETAEVMVYYAWTIVAVAIGVGRVGTGHGSRRPRSRSLPRPSHSHRPGSSGRVTTAVASGRFLGSACACRRSTSWGVVRDQVLVLGTTVVGSVSIVAYWSVVLRALQAPGMLLWGLLRVSFPAMSRTRSAGRDPVSMLPRLLAAATILAGTLLAPLAGAAPALVPLLFGDKWSPAAGALSVACLAIVIHAPVVIAGQSYLWTAGEAKWPLRAMIADAVILVAVGLPLVPIIGVLGLAVGGVVAAIVHTGILAHALNRQTDIRVFRHIRGPVLTWMVAAGAAWGCAQVLARW